jgi:hypothetical protein
MLGRAAMAAALIATAGWKPYLIGFMETLRPAAATR